MNLRALLIFVFCFICISPVLRAQTAGNLYLQSGTVRTEANLAAFVAGPVPTDVFGGYYYRILQFGTLPDGALRAKMEAQGILLMDYLPEKAFLAATRSSLLRECSDSTAAICLPRMMSPTFSTRRQLITIFTISAAATFPLT